MIVRHPMSRLASVYYQKFVELKDHKAWKKVSGHPNNNSPLPRTARITKVGLNPVLFRLLTESYQDIEQVLAVRALKDIQVQMNI